MTQPPPFGIRPKMCQLLLPQTSSGAWWLPEVLLLLTRSPGKGWTHAGARGVTQSVWGYRLLLHQSREQIAPSSSLTVILRELPPWSRFWESLFDRRETWSALRDESPTRGDSRATPSYLENPLPRLGCGFARYQIQVPWEISSALRWLTHMCLGYLG